MAHDESSLLELIHLPALLVDSGRVTYANPSARELLGGHIVAQDVRIALRNPDAVALIASGETGTVRISGLSVPGSEWNVTCQLLDGQRQLVTLDDLSIRLSVARAHADFVANASHELRTPLAAILGYVETLDNPKAGGDAETRSRFLGIIRHEAQRMQALVEDLMSLSRIEAGKHDAPDEKLDMVAMARQAVAEAAPRGRTELVSNVESAIVAGDQGQLAQVLRNLVDNALKYGRSDGTVRVSIEVSETGRLLLAVQDEGEGIAPEHLPRLTERFYRADASRSRAAGGTGLGLSIVKHVVERHRGRFDIASTPGKGTTATVILPLVRD